MSRDQRLSARSPRDETQEQQAHYDTTAQGIVLPAWAQAVLDGERTVERAMRDMQECISKTSEPERIGWRFTQQLLAIKPRKTRPRKRRGLPTAWLKFNCILVDDVVRFLGLKKLDPYSELALSRKDKMAFTKAAKIWRDSGVDVQNDGVKAAYYRRAKEVKRS